MQTPIISRDPHTKNNTRKTRKNKEKHDDQLYYEPVTVGKLKAAIKQKNAAPVEYTIHSQMIKKLPPETFKHLLGLYNRIWEEGIVPVGWKSATKKNP